MESRANGAPFGSGSPTYSGIYTCWLSARKIREIHIGKGLREGARRKIDNDIFSQQRDTFVVDFTAVLLIADVPNDA